MRTICLAAILSVLVAVSASAVAAAQPIHLTRAAFRLKDGEVWGHWGGTLACSFRPETLTWEGNSQGPDTARLSAAFDDELTKAGLAPARSASLFDEAPKGGLQLGVVITHMDALICSESDNGRNRQFRGKMTMSAEWQVYDPVRAEVIARLSTSAFGETKTLSRDGVVQVLLAAFRANAQELFVDQGFRHALKADGEAPTANATLPVRFTPAFGKRPIAAAPKSVATVITADGWGSGFLISPDGYMLTNHHVVGSAEQVRVRWEDKSEGVAQVVRSDRRRDVALLKVEPNGHPALPMRAQPPQPGETVFAIGTPLDRTFQNTVTKGVVSASRTVEGQSFVQSDVAVDHGNSGGPLLDEDGQVIAITDWGYAPDGVSHNLNFFIPIDDALRILALTPVAPAPPPTAAPSPTKPLAKPKG